MWGWKVFWSANLSKSMATKMRLLRTLVMSVLLYGAETRTTAQKDVRKLRTFHMKCLLVVTCWDKNEIILRRANYIKCPSKDNSGKQDSNTQFYIFGCCRQCPH